MLLVCSCGARVELNSMATGVNGPTAGGISGSGGSSGARIVPRAIAAGYNDSCALLNDRTVKCWGTDSVTGVGGAVNSLEPVLVANVSDAVALATGTFSTCAANSNGSAQCWGSNGGGQLGTGDASGVTGVVTVSNITSAIGVAAGSQYSCALLSDGTIQCWGTNNFGVLGNGTTTNSYLPVPVLNIQSAVAVVTYGSKGSGTCALISDGTIDCWGYNNSGQLGNGTTANSSLPVPVTGISNAIYIAGGFWGHSCAATRDGSVECWGMNSSGQLGDGTQSNSLIPVAALGVTSAIAVAAGGYHTCAVLSNGSVQCWGSNSNGQLGIGSTASSYSPVTVSNISTATSVATGTNHSCALLSDNTMRCWGSNSYGQLGDGSQTDSPVPVAVHGL